MSDALKADDVARALGISCDLFLRTRTQLEQRGFPQPLPLVSRPLQGKTGRGRPPLRWCADLVEAWKRGELTPRQKAAAEIRAPRREREKLSARLG